MKLPRASPLEENVLCSAARDFSDLISTTLSGGKGAFFKVFGKSASEAYYITLLVDDQKVLAIEAENVKSGGSLVGEAALRVLKDLLSGPVVVDAYPLDDINLKTSVVDNIDVYNVTPKLGLNDIFEESGKSPELRQREVSSDIAKAKKPERKPVRTEISLKVPNELEPYFRVLANHLKSEGKAFGLKIKRIRIEGEEIRYALGAGIGIHSVIDVEAEMPSDVSPVTVREALESRAYREAAELSKEIGKRIVVKQVNLSLS